MCKNDIKLVFYLIACLITFLSNCFGFFPFDFSSYTRKMRGVFVLLALVAVAQAVSFADIVKEEWQAFKVSNIYNIKNKSIRIKN